MRVCSEIRVRILTLAEFILKCTEKRNGLFVCFAGTERPPTPTGFSKCFWPKMPRGFPPRLIFPLLWGVIPTSRFAEARFAGTASPLIPYETWKIFLTEFQ